MQALGGGLVGAGRLQCELVHLRCVWDGNCHRQVARNWTSIPLAPAAHHCPTYDRLQGASHSPPLSLAVWGCWVSPRLRSSPRETAQIALLPPRPRPPLPVSI